MSQRKRAPLPAWSWLKWLPFFVLPYLALTSEAWLHMGRIQNGYEASEIRARVKVLESKADELDVRLRDLENLDQLSAKAPGLGLVTPAPGQVVVVAADDESTPAEEPPLTEKQPVELAHAAGPGE